MWCMGAMTWGSGNSALAGNPMGAPQPGRHHNGLNWVALILPYIEQGTMSSSINFSLGYGSNASIQAIATVWYTRLGVLSCPSDGDQQGFRNWIRQRRRPRYFWRQSPCPSGQSHWHGPGSGVRLPRQLWRQLCQRLQHPRRDLPDRVGLQAFSPGSRTIVGRLAWRTRDDAQRHAASAVDSSDRSAACSTSTMVRL